MVYKWDFFGIQDVTGEIQMLWEFINYTLKYEELAYYKNEKRVKCECEGT